MPRRGQPVWCVRLLAPAAALPAIETALALLDGALVSDVPTADNAVSLSLYLVQKPDRTELVARLAAAALAAGVAPPEVTVEALPATDWVAESQKALPAIQVGPFYIFGAHVAAAPPAGSFPLRIEASVAFGTGRHESTRGCLQALADLAKERPVARALDMGCGSGILALAIAKLWACPVLAVDNDADAVRAAAENARDNGVADLVEVRRGDGYACRAVGRAGPYALIVENILAEAICDLAPDLERQLAPGGVAILSGLLAEQAAQVLAAHGSLVPLREIRLGEWVTLILSN